MILKITFNPVTTPVSLNNTSAYEINKTLHSLKSKDSHGFDGVSTKILKNNAPYIVSPLTYIFNRVLLTGIFPDRLKIAEVQHLFKNGDKTKLSKYRPISLLTSFSKIIEKIIYKRLYKYLNVNNILAPEQFGFRKKSSTDMAIYTF